MPITALTKRALKRHFSRCYRLSKSADYLFIFIKLIQLVMKTTKLIITFFLLLPLMAMLCIDTTYCSSKITAYYFIGLISYCALLYIIFKHSNLIKTE